MKPFSYNRSEQNWLFKYRLYHIPFWLLYNYLWWAIQVGNPIKAADAILFTPFAIKYGFYVIFQALAVYFNLYFLIPVYLEKRKSVQYIIYLLITISCAAALIVPGYYLSAFLSGKTLKELYGTGSYSFYSIFIGNPLYFTTASMTLAMSIKLAKNWLRTERERRQQQLEKEKLETELNFLKYQFNPHFLFNTINSIFFLIHKNPHKASASLAKFSDLLRYQLYECNDTQIRLDSEIGYLKNFIELEKLRQNSYVEVSLRIKQHPPGHLAIAPFILMTFVENAFKHVSKDTANPNWIRITMDFTGSRLSFFISNSTSHSAFKEAINYGGIGLKNVQRRLDLIYFGQYDLNIQSNGNSFEVRLDLLLSELLLPQPIQKAAAI